MVFDFDGTIADSMAVAWKIYNELAEKYAFKRLEAEELAGARDMGTREFIKYAGISKLRIPRLLTEGKRMMAGQLDEVTPIPGMPEVIRELREKVPTLGILTSNTADNVRHFLKREGLEVFDFISTVPKLSGKHKNLRGIMKTFTYVSDEVLYIGDETRDIKGAKKAPVKSAGVTWGFNSEKALALLEPDYLLKKPVELMDLVKE